jgi:hypothetical protein
MDQEHKRRILDQARMHLADRGNYKITDPIETPRLWQRPEPEPQPMPRGLDTPPVDWQAQIAEAIANEHQFMSDILSEVVAGLQDENEVVKTALQHDLQKLRIEIAEMRVKLVELEVQLAKSKETSSLLRKEHMN